MPSSEANRRAEACLAADRERKSSLNLVNRASFGAARAAPVSISSRDRRRLEKDAAGTSTS